MIFSSINDLRSFSRHPRCTFVHLGAAVSWTGGNRTSAGNAHERSTFAGLVVAVTRKVTRSASDQDEPICLPSDPPSQAQDRRLRNAQALRSERKPDLRMPAAYGHDHRARWCPDPPGCPMWPTEQATESSPGSVDPGRMQVHNVRLLQGRPHSTRVPGCLPASLASGNVTASDWVRSFAAALPTDRTRPKPAGRAAPKRSAGRPSLLRSHHHEADVRGLTHPARCGHPSTTAFGQPMSYRQVSS